MKILLFTAIIAAVSLTAASCAPAQITLDAQGMLLKEAIESIASQAGIQIVLDPGAKGSVTLSLNSTELNQALDIVTKANKLTWRKVQFAKPAEKSIALEQLKSSILALASMPIVGLSMDDPTTKTSAVFAKSLPESPDTSSLKLPEGYSWVTVYVVYTPHAPATKQAAAADKAANKPSTADQISPDAPPEFRRALEIAAMDSSDRVGTYAQEWQAQMNMTPEARRAMLRDRIRAIGKLAPADRKQFEQDLAAVFGKNRARTLINGLPKPNRRK